MELACTLLALGRLRLVSAFEAGVRCMQTQDALAQAGASLPHFMAAWDRLAHDDLYTLALRLMCCICCLRLCVACDACHATLQLIG